VIVLANSTAYTEEQARIYDEKRFTTPAGRLIHRFERDRLLEALRLADDGAAVLEVGCGTGRLLAEARTAGYRADGVDLSEPMLAALRADRPDLFGEAELIVGEAAAVPKPDATYDFVYAIRLLNQTESPAYALDVVTEMLRLVRPGGHVLAEFTNAHRPRIGRNRRPTTRLAPAAVARRATESGGRLVHFRGAFFTSMQAYHAAPGWLAPLVHGVDRALSALLPRLCSRCYALIRRETTGDGARAS
jgi:ubiquinone/menaquinone biosynthesis C-methylase UbiE